MRCTHALGSTPGMVQDISCVGIFFRIQEYLTPGSVYAVELELPDDPLPLKLATSICFIGRTISGFGLGAHIIEPALEKRLRWQRFYDDMRQRRTPVPQGAIRVVAARSCITPELQAELEEQGMAVEIAGDNHAALGRLQPHRRAVVLAEMHDAQLGGRKLCGLLKQRPDLARVAAILVTASASAAEIRAGLLAGAAYVLVRPFFAEYCASRVIAAARLDEPRDEPGAEPHTGAPGEAETAAGASFEYLHPPSILPACILKAADRLSDVFFFTRLAARDGLRRARELVAGDPIDP